MENRSMKNQAQDKNQTTNGKHPNQYTKGADDESAKNCKTTNTKNCR